MIHGEYIEAMICRTAAVDLYPHEDSPVGTPKSNQACAAIRFVGGTEPSRQAVRALLKRSQNGEFAKTGCFADTVSRVQDTIESDFNHSEKLRQTLSERLERKSGEVSQGYSDSRLLGAQVTRKTIQHWRNTPRKVSNLIDGGQKELHKSRNSPAVSKAMLSESVKGRADPTPQSVRFNFETQWR
jgi:hypothetical protein